MNNSIITRYREAITRWLKERKARKLYLKALEEKANRGP